MTKPSETQLREAMKRLENRVKALELLQGEAEARLQKVEVVRVPSPTVEPDYPQRPETE